jgi:glyoxalase-like protein
MLRGHDHTIFLVPDPDQLDVVTAAFEAVGFLITDRDDRDKDKAPTAQRLICFADGSYIEILTIRDAAARARHRFANLLSRGNGWADYSIWTDSLGQDRQRLVAAGLPVSGPHEHKRELSDGRPWGVRLILAGIGAGLPALPFLLEDTNGRELRIPSNRTHHPNGITGTAGVTVAVRSLAEASPQFAAMFGPGSHRYVFGSQWVELVESEGSEGLASVTFRKPGGGAKRPLKTILGPRATMFVEG